MLGLMESYNKIYGQVQNKSVEEVDNYDQILEYLLSEGYSKEESNQIMVELINEAGLGSLVKGAKAVAGFIAKRAKTPLRTAATDSLITSTALNPVSTAKLAQNVAKSASPTPIVRTVKASPARTAPKGSNKITTNVWNEPTAPRSRINPSKPSGTKVTSTKALSGTPSRPALPSAGETSASVKAPKPTFKPEALPKVKSSTAEPAGALVRTRAPKPTFKPEALPKTKETPELAGALVRTRAPKPTTKPKTNRSTSGGEKPSKGGGLTQTVRATLSPAEKTGNMKYPGLEKYATGSSSSGGPSKSSTSSLSRNLKTAGIVGTAAAGAAAVDQVGKENKRKQDQKIRQSIKTDVYNTMDPDTTIRSRKKVGPKIVGTGSVAGDFDVAFKKARTSGQKQFEFRGKKYTTQMKEEIVIGHLIHGGYASDEKTAVAIMNSMSESWINLIFED
jgi:hypothetical protein